MNDRPRRTSSLSPLSVVIFSLTLALALAITLGFRLLPSRYPARVGEVSAQTVKAPSRTAFVSKVKTKERQDQAVAVVGEVLVHDPEVKRKQINRVAEIDQRVSLLRSSEQLSQEQRLQSVRQMGDVELSPNAATMILGLSEEQWRGVVAETVRLVNEILDERLSAAQATVARERVAERTNPSLSAAQRAVVTELAKGLIRPNLLVDETMTEQQRQLARQSVEPVQVTIEKGETIVRDGEVVDALSLEKLEAVGLLKPQMEWPDVAGVSFLSLLLSLVLGWYILAFKPQALANWRRLALLGVVVVGAVLAAKLIIPGRELYYYLFPLAAAPMLVATLLEVQLAIVVTAILGVLASYVGAGSLELVVVYVVGGVAGILGVGRADHINRFFLAGGGVALATFLASAAFWLMIPERSLGRLGWLAVASAGNGVLSASLTVGIFALLGFVFGIATSLHLMELAQPNHPLLQRLSLEAPGTYHHSVVVGNLAGRAAEILGADALLVRVGCYYHDIGKMIRPWAFVENQIAGQNVHDRLDPETSASIIASHVSEGLTLAQKHRIPAKVRDFITEHHGTRLITYFYHRAAQDEASVDPGPYSYDGPRPHTKETGIVMLADSVEAAVRSSEDQSPEEVDLLVDKMVGERLAEGQLDDCDLTLRDIDLIRASFKDTLKGIYHRRIEYPEITPRQPFPIAWARKWRGGGEAPASPSGEMDNRDSKGGSSKSAP